MHILAVTISNYRCIRRLSMSLERFNVLVGPNNHGKSTILSALAFFLSPSTKLSSDDFFAHREPDDNLLWVELTFGDLTPQERTTFAKYVRLNHTVRLRKTATLDGDTISSAYQGYVQEPAQWWLKSSALDRLSTRDKIAAEAAMEPQLQGLLQNQGRITRAVLEDFQKTYIEANRPSLELSEVLEDGPLFGQKNVAAGLLPDFFVVPAVRDIADEAKTTSTAMFGRLLQRAVGEMIASDERFLEIQSRLRELVTSLNAREAANDPAEIPAFARLEELISNELADWGAKALVRVSPPDLQQLVELGAEIRLNDGLETAVTRKGHGLQRAVLFALLRVWARTLQLTAPTPAPRPRAASESVIFAYEEPELFLHPHAQRSLALALRDIAAAPQHQVLLTSHSTHFVDLSDHRSLTVVRRKSVMAGPSVRQHREDIFAGEDLLAQKKRFHLAEWVNPDRGEIFFARKVVLVEGETEKAVLPYLARRDGCHDPSVSVVDCGSKNNLALYGALCNAFKIPYLIVHDEDPVPDPLPPAWQADRIVAAQRCFAVNADLANLIQPDIGSICVLSPDFEGAGGISRRQAERKGKALAALDHLEELADGDLPEALLACAREAYAPEAPVH